MRLQPRRQPRKRAAVRSVWADLLADTCGGGGIGRGPAPRSNWRYAALMQVRPHALNTCMRGEHPDARRAE